MRRLVTLLVVVATPSVAAAQPAAAAPSASAIDVQNLWPAAGPQQAVALRSSDVQPHLSLGFGLVANHMYRPLLFREQTAAMTAREAVGHALTTDFVWGIGLFDRVQLGVALPLVVAQAGEGVSVISGGGAAAQLPQTALRDVRFDVGVALVQRPRRTAADGAGLRLDVGGALPLGEEQNYQGAASATFAPTLVADYRIVGFTVTANVGARAREAAAVAGVVWASQAVLGVGLAYRPLSLDRLMFGADWVTLVPLHDALEVAGAGGAVARYEPVVPMELYAGGRYAVDRARDIEVTLAAGAPLSGAATVPTVRAIAGVAYTPHGFDNDADGVTDAEDECPARPEDRDGHDDRDGCPDPDNDADGVVDPNDSCPDAPEDRDGYRDRDGCPDRDNDADGVTDADDACAMEPAGPRPDPDRDGCPSRDGDHDGVPDAADGCPTQPAGPRPDPQRPGCALADRDNDRVEDASDACPDEPQGDRPDRARRGCPDPDRDRDGVGNTADRCVDAPETVNGNRDDDGCPDEGAEQVTWAGNVLIFRNAIRLRARATRVPPAAAALLAQAARRVRARGAEAARVRVEVVPARRSAAADAEAARLAGLAADVLAREGVARERITAGAAATGATGAAGAAGELRVRIEIAAAGAPRLPSPGGN